MCCKKTGTLYICPTPIGNLEDVTLRTLRILKEVDFIAAEDTRVTIKLLNHYNIKTSLISYHKFSEKQKSEEIIHKLKDGFSVALVSDCGTPVISDPGSEIIFQARSHNIPVIPLPGCSAVSCAASMCNIAKDGYIFIGFLPKTPEKIDKILNKYTDIPLPVIIFESPKRIFKTLEIILNLYGNIEVFIAREMTKIHEEFISGQITTVIEHLQNNCSKGEYTVILNLFNSNNSDISERNIKKLIQQGLQENKSISAISKEIAKLTSLSKNDIYKIALDVQNESEE